MIVGGFGGQLLCCVARRDGMRSPHKLCLADVGDGSWAAEAVGVPEALVQRVRTNHGGPSSHDSLTLTPPRFAIDHHTPAGPARRPGMPSSTVVSRRSPVALGEQRPASWRLWMSEEAQAAPVAEAPAAEAPAAEVRQLVDNDSRSFPTNQIISHPSIRMYVRTTTHRPRRRVARRRRAGRASRSGRHCRSWRWARSCRAR